MTTIFDRNRLLLGDFIVAQLAATKVMVIGLGGVGSYAAEALARLGVGHLYLVDNDVIDVTNINRQLFALHSTIGHKKIDVAMQRLKDINPQISIVTFDAFITEENIALIDPSIDYVVDAIDTLSSKIAIYDYCQKHHIPFISSAGMANRLHGHELSRMSLDKTTYDPLCKQLRHLARQKNIDLSRIPMIVSKEIPVSQTKIVNEEAVRRKERIPPASIVLVPSSAGLFCASAFLEDFMDKYEKVVVAGGCFWGVEAYYRRLKGIVETEVGYAQGFVVNPLYPEVKKQQTGHAEVVEVTYDKSLISLETIFDHLFRMIDPTSLNRQGEDEGTQYRTGLYVQTKEEYNRAKKYIELRQKEYNAPIVVEVEYLKKFYSAEEYHQDYLEKNPTGYCHVNMNLIKDYEKK